MELESRKKHIGMENIELRNVTNLAETRLAGIPKIVRIFVYIVIAVAVRW
jgi:flagellar biosynthesis protein FliQ